MVFQLYQSFEHYSNVDTLPVLDIEIYSTTIHPSVNGFLYCLNIDILQNPRSVFNFVNDNSWKVAMHTTIGNGASCPSPEIYDSVIRDIEAILELRRAVTGDGHLNVFKSRQELETAKIVAIKEFKDLLIKIASKYSGYVNED